MEIASGFTLVYYFYIVINGWTLSLFAMPHISFTKLLNHKLCNYYICYVLNAANANTAHKKAIKIQQEHV